MFRFPIHPMISIAFKRGKSGNQNIPWPHKSYLNSATPEILYLSDMKYNEMTVEIQYNGQQVAQINKDKGVDKIEIHIYSKYVTPEFVSELKLPGCDFLEPLNIARKT